MIRKEIEMAVYVVKCSDSACWFWGDQVLSKEGKLFCPLCRKEQVIDSDLVEKVEVESSSVPKFYDEKEGGWVL